MDKMFRFLRAVDYGVIITLGHPQISLDDTKFEIWRYKLIASEEYLGKHRHIETNPVNSSFSNIGAVPILCFCPVIVRQRTKRVLQSRHNTASCAKIFRPCGGKYRIHRRQETTISEELPRPGLPAHMALPTEQKHWKSRLLLTESSPSRWHPA